MIDALTGTMPTWLALLGAVLGGMVSYAIGKLRGFNSGVAHGRASQGAINEFAEALEASVTPGRVDLEPEDIEAALREWLTEATEET